jgi:hypothetical protein
MHVSIFITFYSFSQENIEDRKKIIDTPEIDFITSYYSQNGNNSAVTGGLGTEKLTDIASDIVFLMPIKKDNTLMINFSISSYTSASSSNINPFNFKLDDDEDNNEVFNPNTIQGTPWQSSSGASQQDALVSVNANYSHHNKKRNRIYDTNVSFSNEYDYTSIGFGGGFLQQLNDGNTEFSVKLNVFLDAWRPIYPIEFRNEFNNLTSKLLIYDSQGNLSNLYNPSSFNNWNTNNRSSYSSSFIFSQVINKKINISIFADVVLQTGKLSTPFNRMYFKDKDDFFIGNNTIINNYQNSSNSSVFHLGDAIEKLPENRIKIPIGIRTNYFINDIFVFRGYYRFYWDDWGLSAHTFNLEVPSKLTEKLTITPAFRYYNQNSINYFLPYNQHLSTSEFYTSDYDLSAFNANQIGLSLNYHDIFSLVKLYKFGMKNIELRFQNYKRSDGLSSFILTLGTKIVIE